MEPIAPKMATNVYKTTIPMLNAQKIRLLGFLTRRNASIGKMKSRGVNPIAPQSATKSPKNGMAAAIRVTSAVYIEVTSSRAKLL